MWEIAWGTSWLVAPTLEHSFFVRRSSLSLMFLRVLGGMGSPRPGGVRCVGIGVRYVVMDHVGLFRLWNLGFIGYLLICMVSIGG